MTSRFKNVFLIRTAQLNASGHPVYFNFACEIETLTDLVREMRNGRLVEGEYLYTRFRRDETGEFLEITARKPCAIGPQVIGMVEPQAKRIVEFVE